MKKDIITRIIWKIQNLAITKLYELFLWLMISGIIYTFIIRCITSNYLYNIYFDIFLLIFIYYACYKIILEP
jgi:hypothetical protein